MPNIVPGVRWQPIDVGNRAARRKGRGLVGHVAVSSSKNLVPGPLASRNADWHLYFPKFEVPIQYIDLDLQCWATGAGNPTLVAFESEGGLGSTAQVNAEPWTENQLYWAAHVLRYLHDTEGVPLRVMASSASGERGFGTHRLGVPGYMAAGGEVWSSSQGKACPGDAKHAQRFEIVRRATAGGTDVDGWLDMAISDDILGAAKDAAARARHLETMLSSVGKLVTTITAKQAASDAVLQQLAAKQGTPIDMAAIGAVVEKSVADAISSIDTTVHIDTNG